MRVANSLQLKTHKLQLKKGLRLQSFLFCLFLCFVGLECRLVLNFHFAESHLHTHFTRQYCLSYADVFGGDFKHFVIVQKLDCFFKGESAD